MKRNNSGNQTALTSKSQSQQQTAGNRKAAKEDPFLANSLGQLSFAADKSIPSDSYKFRQTNFIHTESPSLASHQANMYDS